MADDFFSSSHASTAAPDDATALFAKAINDRFSSNPSLLTSVIHPPPTGRPPPAAAARPPTISLVLNPPPPSSRPVPHPPNFPRLPAQLPASNEFPSILPNDLPHLLSHKDTLVLDLRPLAIHHASRLPSAIPLSVPSTLLKRPLFSTAKLADMLPTKSTRRRFSQWRAAPRILVYDADSSALLQGSNILGLLRKFRTEYAQDRPPDSSASPNVEHELLWLRGGFQAVLRDRRDLVDTSPLDEDEDEDDLESAPAPALPQVAQPTLRTKNLPMSAFSVSSTTSLRTGATAHHQHYLERAPRPDLVSAPTPSTIAQSASTVAYNPFYDNIRQNLELSHGVTERIPLRISQAAKERASELPFAWLRDIGRWAGVDGEGDGEGDEFTEGASGSGTGIDSDSDDGPDSGGDGHDPAKPHVRFPLPSPPPDHSLPKADEDVAVGSEALAMQFYRIELGEQRRLMGVMAHHSRESGQVVAEGDKGKRSPKSKSGSSEHGSPKKTRKKRRSGGKTDAHLHGFPYSITAGVEKGTKNRYRNIWPFEHARVRLQKKPRSRPAPAASPPAASTSTPAPLHALRLPDAAAFLPTAPMWDSRGPDSLKLPLTTPVEMTSDDYVNASYVQPLGTTKRYIATQGPLPETFVDFWTLVWEQNVHVIVMLTREVEGATVKSGNYWSGTRFGPLRLKLVSTTASGGPEGEAQRAQQPQSGFFFPTHHSPPKHPGRSDSDDSSEGMDRDSTIRRVLELSHSGYPHLPPRRVVHLQYLEWPDMNVPDDPKGILRLIREVEKQVDKSEKERGPWEGPRRPDQWRGRPKPGAILPMGASGSTSNEGSPGSGKSGSGGKSTDDEDAVDEQNGIMKHALCERPVLLHCSAGVGRTGGFIAVDAVLDGVRREMRKRRSGVPVPSLVTEPPSDSAPSGTSGGGSLQGARSGDSADNEQSGENENSGGGSSGLGSRASVSGKETPGSGEEVMPMDVDLEKDEDSAGGRAHAHSGPGLVMSLPIAAGGDRAVHVPVVGIRTGPTTPPPTGQRGQALVPMDVDKPSPWRANDPRHAVQQWTPGFGAGSIAATPPPPSAASRESVLSPSRDSALSASPAPPASSAVSRSMSPEDSESGSGESGSASSGGFPLFPSATRPPFPPTRSTMGGSRSLQGVAAANRTSLRTSSTLGGPLASMSLPSDGLRLGSPFVEVPRKADPPVIPPLSTVDSDSSSSMPSSNPPSSLFSLPRSVILSSPLPTSREDSKSASVSSLELKGKMRSDSKGSEENVKSALSMRGMQIPLERMETVKPLIPALPSKTPPDYMMVSRSESQSQSQSQAQSQSPPTFDYTLPRVLHDDRHSPTLLSSLDEPIRRVIEDMREQRMSLCQSLRQYVFVHRAVIEGVLMLIDEERAMYGEAWMDVDEEQELRVSVGKEMDIGAGPMVRPGMGVLKHSSGTTGTTNSSSPSKHKRGPSPTELAREDPMGGVRLSKRPSIKRKVRSSDEDDAAAFRAKSGMGS